VARLGAGLLVLGGLVAVSLVAATPIAASRATTPAEALFVGPAVALARTSAGGCNAVWLSHDFSTWTELAPLGTLCSSYSWASAAFVSPQLGWLYGIDRALVRAVLLRTDDGGAHWTREPAGTLGGFKAEVSIGFSSAHLGWRQQFNVGANGGFGLEPTLDGGKSWRRLPYPSGHGGCEWWPDSFATTRRGFAGPTLSPFLLETTDQGAGWHRFGLPAPASLRLDHAYYQLPRFFANGLGVLAVFYAGSQHSNVAFYETSDAGSTWRLVDVADGVVTRPRRRFSRCLGAVTSPPVDRISCPARLFRFRRCRWRRRRRGGSSLLTQGR